MLPAMAGEEWLELEFADGTRPVDQPYAGWIIEAAGGVDGTKRLTFKQAMKAVNVRPMKNFLRGVERQVYRDHFRGDLG